MVGPPTIVKDYASAMPPVRALFLTWPTFQTLKSRSNRLDFIKRSPVIIGKSHFQSPRVEKLKRHL